MAWLTGGVPSSRLVRIIEERGIAPLPGKDQIHQFETAGADSDLIRALASLHAATNASPETPLPAPLLKAASDAKAQRFHEAELDLRPALISDPKNAALHFALGNMLIRQEQWDDAFDEITLAAQLMPDLPENHSSLAYIFYRLDDGPNAIAEARTALSMDPRNAEAYQFLGLALYSSGQYAAAVHAFEESLAREAANADTYYDLGITLHAAGNESAAITAYRQAIRLNPSFWEAHSNLALIFHEEKKLEDAIAEYREAKRLAPAGSFRSQQPWAIPIATKATSTLPFSNWANFTANIPSGNRVMVVWPAPICRKRNTAAPSRNGRFQFCRILPVPPNTVCWGKHSC